jgi:hypothetical protein
LDVGEWAWPRLVRTYPCYSLFGLIPDTVGKVQEERRIADGAEPTG